MDPWSWVERQFSGDHSNTGGGPPTNKGVQPVLLWAIGYSFQSAGIFGQYMAAIFGNPGSGIPDHAWMQQQDRRARAARYGAATGDTSANGDQGPAAAPKSFNRSGGTVPPPGAIDEVRVHGFPVASRGRSEDFRLAQNDSAFRDDGKLYLGPTPPLFRPARRVKPAPAQNAMADFATVRVYGQYPEPPDAGSFDPLQYQHSYRNVEPFNFTPVQSASRRQRGSAFPFSDAFVREYLQQQEFNRPERNGSASPEKATGAPAPGALGASATVPLGQRTFWNRGGTAFTGGALSAAVGVAVLMWWNPVGWVAGASVALAIAGGIAAGAGGALELGSSYLGTTSAEQDALMDRATSAALAVTSPGDLVGGVAGTVIYDDPAEGFEQGALWGGLIEGVGGVVLTLPRALRAIPGIWANARPWATSLLLSPLWSFLAAGGGGGGIRLIRKVARPARIRSVEYLGTTPLIERDADWAKFQVHATRTRQEAVFRITNVNGEQTIVLADKYATRANTIVEAKYGDLGQMFKPDREKHIIGQAHNYLTIAETLGGDVGYLVSTERGAIRLTDRFGREFPDAMSAGRIWIDWVPWKPGR